MAQWEKRYREKSQGEKIRKKEASGYKKTRGKAEEIRHTHNVWGGPEVRKKKR